MDFDLEPLIDQLQSRDETIRADACDFLLLLLETTNISGLRQRAITTANPVAILDDATQSKLLDSLAKLFRESNYQRSDLLWLIGKGKPVIGLPIMLDIFLQHFTQMSAEMVYQGLIALENFAYDDVKPDAETLTKLIPLLHTSAQSQGVKNAELANRLITKFRKKAQ